MTSQVVDYKGKASNGKVKKILFSAKGRRFDQLVARQWTQLEDIIFVCGRYEGVDERVANHLVDEEISIGDYVLTGGEIPAMLAVDAVTRLLPGVLGNPDSLESETHNETGSDEVDFPVFTKPEVFQGWEVPKVLLSGHHQEINQWRTDHRKRSVPGK